MEKKSKGGEIILRSSDRAGFRTGQAGKLPRGLHNQGTSTYLIKYCHLLFFGILE